MWRSEFSRSTAHTTPCMVDESGKMVGFSSWYLSAKCCMILSISCDSPTKEKVLQNLLRRGAAGRGHTSICTYTHAYVRKYTCTCTHTCTHMCTHMYTHTHHIPECLIKRHSCKGEVFEVLTSNCRAKGRPAHNRQDWTVMQTPDQSVSSHLAIQTVTTPTSHDYSDYCSHHSHPYLTLRCFATVDF